MLLILKIISVPEAISLSKVDVRMTSLLALEPVHETKKLIF